jgi:hypothetical protein
MSVRHALVLALFVVGCTKSAPPPPPPAPSGPSFRGDVAPVLDKMCARAEGCHGDKATHSVSLDLRPDRAYGALVGAPAAARKGALRVKPNDPAASFLVDKLTGKLGPSEGKAMPLDDMTGAPLVPSPIDPAYIETILKPWIAAGARDK